MAESKKIPKHIAFIMDGNGRWAAKRHLPRKVGHREGVKALARIIEASQRAGVEVVSFFAFSTENWKRPEDEIRALFQMIERFAQNELKEYAKRNYRIFISGERSALPPEVRSALNIIEHDVKDNTGMIINLCINYGGRDEILRIANKLLKQGVAEVDEAGFSALADTAGLPDPDVIVRTSGEQRISNFMLWQAAYSEFIFLEEFWPDLDEKSLDRILEIYAGRKRRFGNIK